MPGEFTAEGGGVHPGKPVIWPTGKPSASITSPSEAQTSGGVRGVPPKVTPPRPGEVAPTPEVPGRPAAAPAREAPAVARPLTLEDIRAHLISLQIEPNDFNTKLASLMLRNGVEVSRTNFIQLLTMLQGTNKSQAMQEAALVLLMKGIDSPEAVKILGEYFAKNPQLLNQVLNLQQSINALNSALGMSRGLLNATLVSQLSALLGQFDEVLRNFKFSSDGTPIRAEMLNNARALQALLLGVQQKAPASDSAESQALSQALMEFQGKLDGVLQNLIAQAILSQSGRSEVNYLYHQIPNAMTNPPKDFEIVIKRDGQGKDSTIDPNNTQVVMSMETENLGKMVVSMIVKNGKVYVIFVFSEKDYGNQGRSLIAKEFGELQQKLADRNYLITGYQVKVDPAMCNIKPYLIPLLPRLDELLRRIDIEA